MAVLHTTPHPSSAIPTVIRSLMVLSVPKKCRINQPIVRTLMEISFLIFSMTITTTTKYPTPTTLPKMQKTILSMAKTPQCNSASTVRPHQSNPWSSTCRLRRSIVPSSAPIMPYTTGRKTTMPVRLNVSKTPHLQRVQPTCRPKVKPITAISKSRRCWKCACR